MKKSRNLEMLAVVARGLRELKDEVVFIGGATVELYLTKSGGEPVRATDDVDCVVEISSRVAYGKMEERLRTLGFRHPLGDPKAPICRWEFSGIIVDVMPADGSILGFSNRWYPEGLAHSQRCALPDGREIAIFSLPYFLASKIEAFLDRGKEDYYGSRDMEDIVALLDRAEDLRDKVLAAPDDLRAFIAKEFGAFLKKDWFLQGLEAHLDPGTRVEGKTRVMKLLEDLSE